MLRLFWFFWSGFGAAAITPKARFGRAYVEPSHKATLETQP